jgi:hypothetical protein
LSQHFPEGTEEDYYSDDDDDDDDDDDSDNNDNSDGSSLSSLQLYDVVGSCWFIPALNLVQPSVYWPSETSVASEYDHLSC